jgi:basic membrane lipoprotein Med (substrate-binding protein (PBP1-ABC) superfamily)
MKNAAALLSLSLLFSCSRSETPAPAPAAATPAAHEFKVGLLTPGSVNDGGWNQIAFEGLTQIKNELGATISNQETKSPNEFVEGFRYFGSRGFDLAFGHGFEFQDAAMAAGKQFPKSIFITTSGSSVAPNVSPMVFELEQATYLLGMIAAHESKSGKAGLVGGIKLPSIDSTFLAFKAGAKAVNPNFEVKEVYIGNFDDLASARLATLTLIDSGADFLFHQANEAGRGVFQACSERKVRCFGSNKNQNDLAPDVIVASAVLDVPSAFVLVAKRVRDHQFTPGVQRLGMKENIVSLVWNDKLKAAVKPETIADVERVRKSILDGSFSVPRGNF